MSSFELLSKFEAVDLIAIAQQVSRGAVKRESLDDLLCGPRRSWMGRYVEMKDTSPVVGQDDENIQNSERNRGHVEKVYRNQLRSVVGQKRTPYL